MLYIKMNPDFNRTIPGQAGLIFVIKIFNYFIRN